VSYKQTRGGVFGDEVTMLDTSFTTDPTRNICQACYLENVKRLRFFDNDSHLSRSLISNSDGDYSTPVIKLDDDNIKTINESSQHRYLNLPVLSGDDLRGKFAKRVEVIQSRNIQNGDDNDGSDDQITRLIQEDIDGKKISGENM